MNAANRDVYVASFLAHRAQGSKPLAYTTLLGPVSGALFDLFRMDANNPTASALVRETKKAIKRVAPSPRKAKEALPLDLLRAALVQARADKDKFTGWRDACILLIMYTALLRQSEVMALERKDISFTSETTTVSGKQQVRKGVSVFVRKAKNDQERKGSVRSVPEHEQDPYLCLRVALEKYLLLRDTRNPMLFYSKRVPASAGARGVGAPLASTTPTFVLRHRLKQAGLTDAQLEKYASNSLRKGGATRAFSAGVSKLTIMRHGAWRSDAVDRYITVPVSEHWKLVDAILRGDDEDEDVEDE